MSNNFLFHCGHKTRVTDTRNAVRFRVCVVCKKRFKTKEVLIGLKERGRPKGQVWYKTVAETCPVTREELEAMMNKSDSLEALADNLKTSTDDLNRWLIQYDL